jgi:hypothetical protein
MAGEYAGALSRRRRAGQQLLCPLVGRQRGGLIPGRPAVPAKGGQQHGSPDWLCGRVDPVQRVLEQRDRPIDPAGVGSRLGCSAEQVDLVQPRRPARVGHPLPQF